MRPLVIFCLLASLCGCSNMGMRNQPDTMSKTYTTTTTSTNSSKLTGMPDYRERTAVTSTY